MWYIWKVQCDVIFRKVAPDFCQIFLAVAWNVVTGKCGIGFTIIDSNAKVFCAGYCPINMEARIKLEAKALIVALKIVKEMGERCSNIYISSRDLREVLHRSDISYHWRHSNCIYENRQLIILLNKPHIDLIHQSWNKIIAALVGQEIKTIRLSLFHQGMEKPKWLMKMIDKVGFHS